jgi:hypothetical protein
MLEVTRTERPSSLIGQSNPACERAFSMLHAATVCQRCLIVSKFRVGRIQLRIQLKRCRDWKARIEQATSGFAPCCFLPEKTSISNAVMVHFRPTYGGSVAMSEGTQAQIENKSDEQYKSISGTLITAIASILVALIGVGGAIYNHEQGQTNQDQIKTLRDTQPPAQPITKSQVLAAVPEIRNLLGEWKPLLYRTTLKEKHIPMGAHKVCFLTGFDHATNQPSCRVEADQSAKPNWRLISDGTECFAVCID